MNTVLIRPFDAAVNILHEDIHTFDPAQLLLIALLHTKVAGVVTCPVILVLFYVSGVDLTDISKHARAGCCAVLTYRAPAYVETGKQA